jgi:ABC-type Fe3+ transport system substrate-binding protein
MKKDTIINKIAKNILNNLETKDAKEYGIDPITIIIIIGVILSLIRVIQECRSKRNLIRDKKQVAYLLQKDIQEIILKDSWINRYRLQKIIKSHLNKQQYKLYGKSLQDSIIETGINLTEQEVYALMEKAND